MPAVAGSRTLSIMLLLNGETLPQLFITIVRYVLPSEDHTIQKLLLLYLEIIDKTDARGRVLPEMILICQNLRNNLQHPNEYSRGVTLHRLFPPDPAAPVAIHAIAALVAAVIPSLVAEMVAILGDEVVRVTGVLRGELLHELPHRPRPQIRAPDQDRLPEDRHRHGRRLRPRRQLPQPQIPQDPLCPRPLNRRRNPSLHPSSPSKTKLPPPLELAVTSPASDLCSTEFSSLRSRPSPLSRTSFASSQFSPPPATSPSSPSPPNTLHRPLCSLRTAPEDPIPLGVFSRRPVPPPCRRAAPPPCRRPAPAKPSKVLFSSYFSSSIREEVASAQFSKQLLFFADFSSAHFSERTQFRATLISMLH